MEQRNRLQHSGTDLSGPEGPTLGSEGPKIHGPEGPMVPWALGPEGPKVHGPEGEGTMVPWAHMVPWSLVPVEKYLSH